MSAIGISVPAVTVTPLLVMRAVPAGTVVIRTAASAFVGESFGSVNPKSATENV